MPWYEYRCEACSAAVRRKVPVAHREATLVHRVEGCEHGRLRRVAPLQGPADQPIAALAAPRAPLPARAGLAMIAATRERVPEPAPPPPSLAGPPPQSEMGRAVQAICAVTEGPARLEMARTLATVLPTLTEKLGLVEIVEPAARGEEGELSDDLAAEVAEAPPGALARERRLLELFRLAKRRGRLAPPELARRLQDDRVVARLLASALRWSPPEPGSASPPPPRLAWAELRELVQEPLLHERVRHVSGHVPASADIWERMAARLAARDLDAVGADPAAAQSA